MKKMKVMAATNEAAETSVRLPSSKSVSNRLLILKALAGGRIENLSNAEDTVLLEKNLHERPATMHCGLGGTPFRLLMAWAACQENEEFLLTGEPRLISRPHDDLMNALNQLGADVRKVDKGFQIRGKKLKGGKVTLTDIKGSQFVSALLIIAPYMAKGIALTWNGVRYSQSYVRMTTGIMKQHGADVKVRKDTIHVSPGVYNEVDTTVHSDWSAASFWYSFALGRNREFRLEGLIADGLQGDEAIKDLLKPFITTRKSKNDTKISSLKAPFSQLEFDLTDTPDIFQPLAISMAAMGIPTTFTGLAALPTKESDRIETMGTILQGMGANVFWTEDTFILGSAKLNYTGAPIPTHKDHRLAMSLVRLAELFPYVLIQDPEVVDKSYPDFWVELMKAGYKLETID